ncbi:putative histidinol-phosphate transaminase, partial [Leptospira interrogans serovar Pyrogenes str. 200701872]
RCVLDQGDSVLINRITFAMYKIYALQCGAKIHSTDSVTHDLNAFLDLAKLIRPKIIFLCTPSNPAGDALSKSDVYEFLSKISLDTLVVIDAAYMEFGKKRIRINLSLRKKLPIFFRMSFILVPFLKFTDWAE